MNALPKVKVFDKLTPFLVVDSGEAEGAEHDISLDNLAVFHENFSQTEELPTASVRGKTYAQGLEEGRALAEQEGAVHLQEIEQLIQVLGENMSILGEQIQSSHRRAITSIIRSVLPRLAEKAAGAEIARFVTEISGQALAGHVEYSVNPSYESKLKTIIAGLEKKGLASTEFSVEGDEQLRGSAVKASWRSGGGSIDIDGAVGKCLSLLEDEE